MIEVIIGRLIQGLGGAGMGILVSIIITGNDLSVYFPTKRSEYVRSCSFT
jgi:hypothetical protein